MSEDRQQQGVAGILNAGSFDGEFFPHTDSMVAWGMLYMDTTQRRVEVHPEGTEKHIAELEKRLKTAQIACDRAEGQADMFAEIIKSASEAKVHEGYTRHGYYEWHFECADDSWALIRKDETHVDAMRQDDPGRWVVGFAKGRDGTWWCEGTDAGEVGRFVPSDVSDAVAAYVLKYGVPS